MTFLVGGRISQLCREGWPGGETSRLPLQVGSVSAPDIGLNASGSSRLCAPGHYRLPSVRRRKSLTAENHLVLPAAALHACCRWSTGWLCFASGSRGVIRPRASFAKASVPCQGLLEPRLGNTDLSWLFATLNIVLPPPLLDSLQPPLPILPPSWGEGDILPRSEGAQGSSTRDKIHLS